MGFLERFSVGRRLFFMALAFCLPIGVLFWIYWGSVNGNVAFAAQEKRGNAYQKPLESLFKTLAESKRQCRLPGGKADTSAVETAFDRVMAVDKLYRDDLFSDESLKARKREHIRADRVKGRWDDLKRQLSTLAPADVQARYQELIDTVTTMISHAGDTSNLILDPDLDSYYLMDVTLLALPQTQNRLLALSDALEPLLAQGAFSQEDRIRAAVFAAQLRQDDHDRIVLTDTPTVLENDAAFYGKSASLQANLPPAVETYSAATHSLIKMLDELAAGKTVAPAAFADAQHKANDASFALWDVAAGELDRLLDIRIGAYRSQLTVGSCLTLLAVLVSALLTLAIARSITGPIGRIIAKLYEGSAQVTAAAGQIASSSQSLADGSTSQAASLEETSAALEEMASMTRQNADNAGDANTMMGANRQQVANASVAVHNMAAAMGEINDSSTRIGKIIKTIEEIAFQTNLLALNAAVEAARAGEAGKGFAVVADEVRNLAQRSAQASRDTSDLIRGTVERVQKGTGIISEFEKRFSEIEGGSRKVGGLIEEISAACHEQAQGVDQVNTAISQMDGITQQNAASAEESASAAAELSTQAENLHAVVAELTRLVRGQGDTAAGLPVLARR